MTYFAIPSFVKTGIFVDSVSFVMMHFEICSIAGISNMMSIKTSSKIVLNPLAPVLLARAILAISCNTSSSKCSLTPSLLKRIWYSFTMESSGSVRIRISSNCRQSYFAAFNKFQQLCLHMNADSTMGLIDRFIQSTEYVVLIAKKTIEEVENVIKKRGPVLA